MKTRILLLMVLVLIAVVGMVTNGAVATPSLPENVKITPPDPSLPPENLAFFGKSGKWSGTYHVPMTAKMAEVLLVFKKMTKDEAEVLMIIEGDVGIATSPSGKEWTGSFVKRGRKILLSFYNTEFWINKNGFLEGDMIARGTWGTSRNTFLLKSID